MLYCVAILKNLFVNDVKICYPRRSSIHKQTDIHRRKPKTTALSIHCLSSIWHHPTVAFSINFSFNITLQKPTILHRFSFIYKFITVSHNHKVFFVERHHSRYLSFCLSFSANTIASPQSSSHYHINTSTRATDFGWCSRLLSNSSSQARFLTYPCLFALITISPARVTWIY